MMFFRYLFAWGWVIILLGACTPQQPALQPTNPAEVAAPTVTAQQPDLEDTPAPTPEQAIGMANPASVYCEQQGGRLEIRSDAQGGQTGICIFPNGSECEEWAYFRGECQPGGQAEPTLTYTNPTFGFSLKLPEGWAVEDFADHVTVRNGPYQLFIGFWQAGTERPIFRTSMPQGDFVDGGFFTLWGQTLPKQALVWEGKTKLVHYGVDLPVADVRLIAWLDAPPDAGMEYAAVDIPPEMIAQADQILGWLSPPE